MKIIDPVLETAMEKRNGVVIARLCWKQWTGFLWSNTSYNTLLEYSFDHQRLHAKIQILNGALYPTPGTVAKKVWIERGLQIQGVNYYEASPLFFITENNNIDTYFKMTAEIVGEVLPDFAVTGITADNDAETVITDTLDAAHIAPEFISKYSEPWRTWQFAPTSATVELNSITQLQSILNQKYLVQTAPGRTGPLFFNFALQYIHANNVPPDVLYDLNRRNIIGYRAPIGLTLKWTDESNLLHSYGTGSRIKNLGFIHSSVASSVIDDLLGVGAASVQYEIDPNLAIENGDSTALTDEDQGEPFLLKEKMVLGTGEWKQWIIIQQYPPASSAGKLTSSQPPTSENQIIDTTKFDAVLSANENTLQLALEKIDDHDHSGLATTEGIQDIIGAMVSSNTETGIAVTYDDTNGKLDFVAEVTQAELDAHINDTSDVHAYTSLSGRPIAETNTNWIYGAAAPGGTSAFVGTINGAPSGTSVVYNVSSGTEGSMKPSATTHLAKMRLYNTTRGTYALISDVNTGTNTITLTATVPAAWANGDTITIASQTVTGAPISYCDFEITSGPTNKLYLFVNMIIISTTVGDNMRYHPLETYGSGKQKTAVATVASQNGVNYGLLKITSNVFSMGWTGTPSNIILTEDGYLE